MELNNIRQDKGLSKIELLKDYVVLDIETTGLDPYFDEIIEIGALKIINGKIVDKFSQLIKPSQPISAFISELTGITNDMVTNEPTINEVLPKFVNFVSNMNIVGHNVHFDINFIYDNMVLFLNKSFKNNFIDTLKLSRKLFRNLENHKLNTVCKHLNINIDNHHRAYYDCEITYNVYEKIKNYILSEKINLIELFAPKRSKKLIGKNITTNIKEFDETHLLFDKNCVFTGTLHISRKEAMQMVVDLGGHCQDNVTKETNFLILGNKDYSSTNKSAKHKKAESYILNGCDINIISENVFMDLVSKQNKITEPSIKQIEQNQKISEEEFEKRYKELVSALNIDFKENINFQINEDKSFAFSNLATASEKAGNIDEAIKNYEKAAFYGFPGNYVYDRLLVLYKKTSQTNKMVEILKFAIFVFDKVVSPTRVDRLPKLKKFYDKYIKIL